MSDETLRELERRLREAVKVEDEAAWLRARVRTGRELKLHEVFRLLRLPGYRFPAHAAVSVVVSNKTLSKAAYYGGTASLERLRQACPESDPCEEAARLAAAAVRAELVPWLLGYGDPVRDRVEARQRFGGRR